MARRICYTCKLEKDLDDFYKDKRKKDGHMFQCKECHKQQSRQWKKDNRDRCVENQKQWVKQNPDSHKASVLKYTYGIDLMEYNRLIEQQHNTCAICGGISEESLYIDHDHETNKIRGLLCRACNFAIGLLKDNPELCEKAAQYLRK